MDVQAKQKRMAEFERLCRERGIPCTIQRRAILDALLNSDDHPTANQIYRAVKAHNRGISQATVHRNLETLVELGLITKTCHPGSVIRYDSCTETHHHLVCSRCNKIIDLHDDGLDHLLLPDISVYDFEVSDFHVQIHGLCKDCRARENPLAPPDE
jgi:Fur family peroxide stress response transcriptional regulator